ncbi:MAG TPA: hypothetical protein VGR10_04570 [Thermoleophilaceae bacterium]|nr:hypothetical protein [Thermoleophilaceae bacterium]
MAGVFELVLIIVVVVAALVAVASVAGTGELYRGIGKGDFSMDEPDRPKGPEPGTAQARSEAEAEIRQMVEAKSARREARGEEALDVESEVAGLTRQSAGAGRDEGLREEVRQLVVARNDRRIRRGQEPLDVDEEVERQLRDLG